MVINGGRAQQINRAPAQNVIVPTFQRPRSIQTEQPVNARNARKRLCNYIVCPIMFDMQNNRELVIYLAGLLDADGSFSIILNTSIQKKFGRPNPQWHETVALKQVTAIGTKLLKQTFGGCTYPEKPSMAGGKPLFCWRANDRTGAKACERLIPFLRIKKRQARLLLLLSVRKAANGNKRLSVREVAARQRLRNQVRKLNSTGTAPRIQRQRKFKEGSIHRVIEFQGAKKTVEQWAHLKGIKPHALVTRLRRMPSERALTMKAA